MSDDDQRDRTDRLGGVEIDALLLSSPDDGFDGDATGRMGRAEMDSLIGGEDATAEVSFEDIQRLRQAAAELNQAKAAVAADPPGPPEPQPPTSGGFMIIDDAPSARNSSAPVQRDETEDGQMSEAIQAVVRRDAAEQRPDARVDDGAEQIVSAQPSNTPIVGVLVLLAVLVAAAAAGVLLML